MKYPFTFLSMLLLALHVAAQMPDANDKKRFNSYIGPARDSLSKSFNLARQVNKGMPGYSYDSLRSDYQRLIRQLMLRETEFIQHNPRSYAALEHFSTYIMSSLHYKRDSMIALFSYFSSDLKVTPLGISISEALNKKLSLGLNKEMPDFSFLTSTGKNLSLSSFRNQKYVLLCFWDSWCAPCIRSIPSLREIAATYRDGLQLIHVSIDDEKGKWLSSLKKYPMSWPQTCDISPYITGSKVRSMYDIHAIPQYYLIDREGTLIYQNVLMDDNDEYTKLHGVLQQVLANKPL
jgi:peroxiredoxin